METLFFLMKDILIKMNSLLRQFKLVKTAKALLRTSCFMGMMKPMAAGGQWQGASLASPLRFGMSTNAPQHKNVMKSGYEGSGYYVEQMLTGCLAIYSYYIESGDDCFLIDPLFDTDQYNHLIKSRGKTLKGIFISHYHADYVSGQYELQKQHGCKIYMGPKSVSTDVVFTLKDKESISLGKVTLECWHTPGHTEESSCLVVIDDAAKRDTIFTGDTLFLNEVGRPDLAVKTDLTAEDLAKLLYNSLDKLKTLNDDIRIYPGHGSGSACGKSIGSGDFCTLGTQKQNNYALKTPSKEAFVREVLQDMPNPPAYFGYNVGLNKFEPFFYEAAAKNGKQLLTSDEVYKLSKAKDVIVLDVRDAKDLNEGIIENSIWVGFDGAFANWVGTLFNPTDRFVIYGTDQQAKESITRLFRIGYINIVGHANFPMKEWKDKKFPFAVTEFVDEVIQPDATVLDVRKPGEWKNDGIVEGATILELSELFKHPERLDKSKTYVTHCRSGYRARIAWSFLLSAGFKAKAFPYAFDALFKSGKAKNVKV